jgi:uncharacterized protein DUF4407
MRSPLKYFFWSCSGATISLLQQPECETEHNKYVGIGAAVFLTGVLAAISASYAFSTIIQSRGWTIALGVFWGAMIFNLDRYLVMSIRNNPPVTNATLKEKLNDWGRVLLVALPRVLLAALLAAAITKPLELLIFNSEIQLEMPSLQADQAKQFQRELETELNFGDRTTLAARIEKLKNENAKLEKEIGDKQAEQEKARQAAVDEAEGRAKLPAGEGRVFQIKTEIAEAKERETKQFIEPKQELLKLNNESIKTLTAQQQQIGQDAGQRSRNTNGLATQLQAFSRLTSKNPVIRSADLLLMAIILILETAPILTKIYARYGPYDKLVDVAEEKVYLSKKLELEDFRHQMETHRDSYERRKDVVKQIQDLVIEDTLVAAGTPRSGSQSHRDLEYAKIALIEQATDALTKNGHKE